MSNNPYLDAIQGRKTTPTASANPYATAVQSAKPKVQQVQQNTNTSSSMVKPFNISNLSVTQQAQNTANSFVKIATPIIGQAIKTVQDYTKSAIKNPGTAIAGAGEAVLTAGGAFAGFIQQGIASSPFAQVGISGTKPAMPIAERWDISKQTQALKVLDDQFLEKQGVDQKQAFEVGRVLGSILPYAVTSELAGLTIGAKVLVPSAQKFLPGAVKFIPTINEAIAVTGVGQLVVNPEEESRADRLKNDLVMLGLFKVAEIPLKALSTATRNLISKTVDDVSGRINANPKTPISQLEQSVQVAKQAIKEETGKNPQALIAEVMTNAKQAPKTQMLKPTNERVNVDMNGNQKNLKNNQVQKPNEVKSPNVQGKSPEAGQNQTEIAPTTVYRGTTKAGQAIDTAKPNGITGGESTTTDKAVAERFAKVNGGEVQEYQIAKDAKIITHSELEKLVADLPVKDKAAAVQKYLKENSIDVVKVDVPVGSAGESELRVINSKVLEPKTRTVDTPIPQTPVGDGKARVSKLGLRVEQTAIEKKLTSELKDLPQFNQMNMKEQAQKAADLIKSDPDKAMRIALGQEAPPAGLLPESVFKAVEGSITTPEMARQLARSPLVSEATALGQRIKALDVATTDSPVEAIRRVIDARTKTIEERLGKTVAKATTDTIKEIEKSVKPVRKEDWASFISSIRC